MLNYTTLFPYPLHLSYDVGILTLSRIAVYKFPDSWTQLQITLRHQNWYRSLYYLTNNYTWSWWINYQCLSAWYWVDKDGANPFCAPVSARTARLCAIHMPTAISDDKVFLFLPSPRDVTQNSSVSQYKRV